MAKMFYFALKNGINSRCRWLKFTFFTSKEVF